MDKKDEEITITIPKNLAEEIFDDICHLMRDSTYDTGIAECKFCFADDYRGSIIHKQNCSGQRMLDILSEKIYG